LNRAYHQHAAPPLRDQQQRPTDGMGVKLPGMAAGAFRFAIAADNGLVEALNRFARLATPVLEGFGYSVAESVPGSVEWEKDPLSDDRFSAHAAHPCISLLWQGTVPESLRELLAERWQAKAA
jgi:hypothetical protein